MALVGTISGSNGTTTSAVSGSLIIANQPPGSFPSLPAGVNFYVSGACGADVDSASALFGGDVFMSGALGLQEYLQLRPIYNNRFPTATTASYMYASGSTNDIYFTQYSGSLRNDVRLRWLEGALATGLLNGGVVSTVNGTTTFSVTAGAGIIVTQNAEITSDPYPIIEYVKWPAFVSSSLTYSGSAQVTYVSVDSSGSLTQLNVPPTLAQYKDRIILGRVLHQTGSVTNGSVNTPAMAYAVTANTLDFIRPFGPLKVSGHVLAASGSTLGLTKTAGDSYAEGRNYAFDPSSPNIILAADDTDLVNCKIYYQYVSGSTTITNTGVGNAGFAVIDRAQYNNNGALAAVGNSEWTNQRVYWFPRAVNRALFVYYGSVKYGTLLDAIDGLLTENFVEGDNTKGSAIYVGSVSVKGNETSLTDTTNVRIVQAGLFRGTGGGGGGGGGSTPPAGLDTYVQFNDGSVFGGDSGLTYNKTTDSLTVAGDITGSNLRLTGDIAVVGGDITSTAATFNFVTGTTTTLNIGGSATTIAVGAANSSTTFAGNVTGSNARLSGDLAVNGGDITSTAGTLNIASTANVTNLYGSSLLLGSTGNVNLSGSATVVNAGSSGLSFQRDGSTYATLTGDATTVSIGATPSRTTANFFVGNVTTLNVGSAITTSSFNGDAVIGGKTTLSTVIEKISAVASSTGTVSFSMTNQGIFYVNNPAGDITANFTNVPTANNRIITPTVILSQSATPRMISAVQIDTVAQTIDWANGTTPAGTANKQDVFGFSLIRSGSAWKVLGQLSTYG